MATEDPITQIEVSLDAAEEQNLQHHGFYKIDVDLNKGAKGKYVYIWYKRGPVPITNLQVSFNDGMADGLLKAGYTKISKDLNAGAGGNFIYLWYYRGSGEYNTPIVDIDITTTAQSEALKFENDWERLACDLNRGDGGNWIHAWVKRKERTYICDVTATDSYGSDKDLIESGYIRVDEDTNRGAGGASVFIWYRQTTDPKRAIRNLNVSTSNKEFQTLQQQKYQSVSVNLNEKTNGSNVYLWYKRDDVTDPIKAITLLLNMDGVKEYEKGGVAVLENRNLNTGNDGPKVLLCFYQ